MNMNDRVKARKKLGHIASIAHRHLPDNSMEWLAVLEHARAILAMMDGDTCTTCQGDGRVGEGKARACCPDCNGSGTARPTPRPTLGGTP